MKRALIHQPTSIGDTIADHIAGFVGSWLCLGLHALWFALWFVFRLDVNLLTLIVSLEAIFLCTIIMMSQNRQADKDRHRDDLEAEEVSSMLNTHQELLHINRTQLEILNQQTDILHMLHEVRR